MITFANSLGPDQAQHDVWIQTVWHSDGIPKRIFDKVDFESADHKLHEKLASMSRVKTQDTATFIYSNGWK